ncbi:MAG: hypothetical protein IPJ61_05045 [Tessaracoccus sp.]|uniref:hypothetical protein n=1 Tax=Tessaracoccus sp. TaxID=1971211 RepID=UPI001EB9C370|nr:hypothetical protein [Tessaracoccus sp.]MBK7820442.1 hypothetical protein [Tessaracoccus sp.]
MSQAVGRRAASPDEPPEGPLPASLARPRRGRVDDPVAVVSGPRHVLEEPHSTLRGRRAPLLLGGLAVLIVAAIVIAFVVFGGRPEPAPPSGTGSPLPSASPSTSASPTVTPLATSEVLQLNDATLTVYDGWSVQDDELVQDGRRLVRLREDATDARVQAVTLTSVAASLEETCTALVADLTGSYTDVEDSAPATIEVAADAEGVVCSFSGERSSDKVSNTVTFSVLRRAADDHALVFRATVPTALPDAASTEEALEQMLCSAASSFDVEITRCATP